MQSEKLFSEFPPAKKEGWKNAIRHELKGKDADSLVWKTEEGFDISPFYTADDISRVKSRKLFTEYKKADWEIRQDVTDDNIKSSNKKALDALSSGATSLAFVTDKIKSKKDFGMLLKDVLPEYISLHFISENNPLQILKWFKKLISQGKIDLNKIRGSVIFEPFEKNNFKKDTVKIVKDLNDFSPFFRGVTISVKEEKSVTRQISDAVSKGNEVLAFLINSGFRIDDIAARIQFSFPVRNNYFFEIAKIRAMRILWAQIVERYKPLHESSSATFIHSEISPESSFSIDKHDNFILNTTRVMSAALGGADSISVVGEDEFSDRVNRDIQLIAKEEAYINKISDAASGSYYVEALTEKIVESASEKIYGKKKNFC